MHALENIRFIESIGTQMENKDYYVVYDKALNKFYSHINCLIDKLKNKKKVYIFGTNYSRKYDFKLFKSKWSRSLWFFG